MGKSCTKGFASSRPTSEEAEALKMSRINTRLVTRVTPSRHPFIHPSTQDYNEKIMEILTRRLLASGIDITQLSNTNAAASSSSSGSSSGCPVFSHSAAATAQDHPAAAAATAGCPMHDGGPQDAGAAAGSINARGSRTIMDLAIEFSRGASGDGNGTIDVATLRDQLMTFFSAGHDTTGAAGFLSGIRGLVGIDCLCSGCI